MEITFWGLVFGALLLLVPVYAMYALCPGMARKVAVAAVRMVVGMSVTGLCLYYLVVWDSVVLSVLFVLLMVVASSYVVVVEAKIDSHRSFVPVFVGMFVAVAVVTAYLLLLVVVSDLPLGPRVIVPVSGFIAGMTVRAESRALSAYYDGLRNHSQMYYYLTGNGATKAEALRYLLCRALKKTAMAYVPDMSVMAVAVCPVAMWSMMLCGVSVLTAAAAQVVFVVASFCTTVLSVLLCVVLSRRFSFDRYGSVRDHA